MSHSPISELRLHMIADMTVRSFGDKTRTTNLASFEILPKELFSLSCHTARSRLVFRVGGVLEGAALYPGGLDSAWAFNGVIMFAIPAAWYASVPGVAIAGTIWMVSPCLANQENKGEQPC
jgi:hypothetical protein